MKLKLRQVIEKEVSLKLIKRMGVIALVVADEDEIVEPAGYLLTFNDDGTIERCSRVSESFGFKLDKCGRIEFAE